MMHASESQEAWALVWRPYLRGVDRVCDFFTKRNLWANAILLDKIRTYQPSSMRDHLLFIFESNLFSGSRLQQYHEGRGGFGRGTYFIPPMSMERKVLECSARKAADCLAATRDIAAQVQSTGVCISTQSATALQEIPSGSIDYIFTDPPYSWKVQFGELNFV